MTPHTIRDAKRADLPQIMALLADDPLGHGRESTDLETYQAAFDRMTAVPGNVYMVVDDGTDVLACLQYTMIHGLSRAGASRAQIEGVRVSPNARGLRIGETLMKAAIDRARADGCSLVQLTTDKSRERAHTFYERLGFTPSHVGMKLNLT